MSRVQRVKISPVCSLSMENVACVALLWHFIVIIIYQHVAWGGLGESLHYEDFKAHVRIKQVRDSIDFSSLPCREVPKWVREAAENEHSGWRSFCAINVALTAEGILCPPDARRAPSGRPPGLPEGA